MARTNGTGSDRTGLRSVTLSDQTPGRTAAGGRRRSKRRSDTARKALLILLSLLLLLGGGLVLAAFVISERLGDQVERIPNAFEGLDEERRPARPPTESAGADALNILLTGVDTGANRQVTFDAGESVTGERTDTIMILHIPGDRKSAILISIPRDSWVEIPGHGISKINAAHSWGGPTLLIETVEQLTALRIDHLAIIGFEGFRDLTDALGGIQMTFPTPVEGASGQVFEAGEHTLHGEQALDYVRARYNLPEGDFDRVRRQQNLVRSLMRQTLSSGTVTNPIKLNKVLNAITQNLAVDDQFTTGKMRGLAIELRGIRSDVVTFMTAPVAGTGWEGDQAVVYLDLDKLNGLFDAVRVDDVDRYLSGNPEADVLGETVR